MTQTAANVGESETRRDCERRFFVPKGNILVHIGTHYGRRPLTSVGERRAPEAIVFGSHEATARRGPNRQTVP